MIKISYLFSRNKKIGSKIISWASGLLIKDLEKVPSHVAILVGDYFVMESTMISGVRCVPYSSWKKKNEECYKIPCQKIYRSEEEVYEAFESVYNKWYDWPGVVYFAICFAKYFLFKRPFPKQNKWQKDNMFFCTEFAGRLSGYKKYSMTTPAKMCSDFLRGENDVIKK